MFFRSAPARLVVLDAAGFRVIDATDAWLRRRRLARDAVAGMAYFELFPGEEAALRAVLERLTATRTSDEHNAPLFAPDGSLRYLIRRDPDEPAPLAHSLSHDLRTPLRAISAYCALLRNLDPGAMPPIAGDLVTRIESSVRGMGTIIDGLLQLSSADTSKMSRRRVELGPIARRIVRDLQQNEPERDVEIVVADDLIANADPSLATLALENLLGNAWKYTRRRAGARIEVGRDAAGSDDFFYVRDNGVGFDLGGAVRLFTPFFRMHSPAEFEGHGLGLATVRRVVERHGGQVWAESRPGEGTTIYFSLT